MSVETGVSGEMIQKEWYGGKFFRFAWMKSNYLAVALVWSDSAPKNAGPFVSSRMDNISPSNLSFEWRF